MVGVDNKPRTSMGKKDDDNDDGDDDDIAINCDGNVVVVVEIILW